METEIWQCLPEDLLYMILARLPMRVLGKMKSVCREWNYLLSSRDALQENVPNWSLHSTAGFVIHFHWDRKDDDVESWMIEGSGSYVCKVPMVDHIIVDSCKSLFCCHTKGDPSALSIGIPGTTNWRRLPPPPIPSYSFSGMTFDSSTRRCTLLLGSCSFDGRIRMAIYDSESNAWTQVSMMLPDHIHPQGKAIYSHGKFHWSSLTLHLPNLIVAFNIRDGLWTEIPVPQGCRVISSADLCEYDGQVVVVDREEIDCIRLWKLNEEGKYEIWSELRGSGLTEELFCCFQCVTVNSSGLIMVIDWEKNVSIFNSLGELMALKMRLPGLRTGETPFGFRVSGSAFESNNLWWP